MKKMLLLIVFIALQSVYSQTNGINNANDFLDVSFSRTNMSLNQSFFKYLRNNKTKLNFMVEYVCVDKKQNVILRRKLDFPMTSYDKVKLDEGMKELPTYIYHSTIELPIEIYNPDSLKSINASFLKTKKHIIQVGVIPQSDNYIVVVKNDVAGINYLIYQLHVFFKFEKGEKFKRLLNKSNDEMSDNIDYTKGDAYIIPFFRDNVWKYVDEYILISLED